MATVKQSLFAEFARVGQALSNGRRLEMLEFLAQHERTVEELARMCGLTVANTSQHLQILRAAGLVTVRKQGQRVYSRLAGDDVFALYRALRGVAQARLAEVEKLARSERTELEEVPLRELRRRMKEGTAVLLDVRPADEYAQGHIAGARSIPLGELRTRLRELPRDVEIIAYCRGPYCFLSDEAVTLLRRSGRPGIRLAEGYPDWKAMGGQVETGARA